MAKRKSEVLFRVKCPLGYSILLDVDCWTKHILVAHPDLAMRYDDVQATLIKPDEILENSKKNRCNFLYVKKFTGKDKYNPFLVVPVCITNKNKKVGWVRSAYPITVIGGGKRIWRQ